MDAGKNPGSGTQIYGYSTGSGLGENAAFTDATLRSIMEAGEKVKS